MILDDNLVFFAEHDLNDGNPTSAAVPLNMLWKAGRAEPVLIWLKAGNAAGGTNIAVKLTASDTQSGTYDDVPGSSITIPLAEMQKNKNIYLRWLPRSAGDTTSNNTRPQWFKLSVTKTGTFSDGSLISAAIVREDDLPYEPGLYIEKGQVVA